MSQPGSGSLSNVGILSVLTDQPGFLRSFRILNAYATPVLHVRRAAEGGLFDGYADSFEQVRRLSRLVRSQPAEE